MAITLGNTTFSVANYTFKPKPRKRRLRTLLLTSHSLNNNDVFRCSLANHQEYCTAHGYDLLNITEAYDCCLDINFLLNMLNIYEVYGWFGTDLFITDMRVGLESFLRPGKLCYIGEDGSQLPDGWHSRNGDFVFFRRPETEAEKQDFKLFLRYILTIQQNPTTRYCGIQNALNIISHPNNKIEISRVIQSFPPRVLQSASPYNEERFREFCWQPGDFCCHFNLLSAGVEVRQKHIDMERFMQDFGDKIIHFDNPPKSPAFEHCPVKK